MQHPPAEVVNPFPLVPLNRANFTLIHWLFPPTNISLCLSSFGILLSICIADATSSLTTIIHIVQA